MKNEGAEQKLVQMAFANDSMCLHSYIYLDLDAHTHTQTHKKCESRKFCMRIVHANSHAMRIITLESLKLFSNVRTKRFVSCVHVGLSYFFVHFRPLNQIQWEAVGCYDIETLRAQCASGEFKTRPDLHTI